MKTLGDHLLLQSLDNAQASQTQTSALCYKCPTEFHNWLQPIKLVMYLMQVPLQQTDLQDKNIVSAGKKIVLPKTLQNL